MQVLQCQNDFCQVKTGSVLHEDALTFQVHEQLTAAQVFEDEVQLPTGLEGIDEVHNERVLHCFQDVPLGFRVGRVFLIAHYCRLLEDFHGEDVPAILAGQLSHLEDFAVPAPAKDPSQFKVMGASLLGPRVHSLF